MQRGPYTLDVAEQGVPVLAPRFHSDRVLQACKPCEQIADFSDGGHGALLSPLPPGLGSILGDMLNDPPGFDRSQVPAVDRKTAAFFTRHLVEAGVGPDRPSNLPAVADARRHMP